MWRITHNDRILVGQRLNFALAAAVGGLVLDYSLADVIARTAAMRDHLVSAALLILLAFSVVAVIGAFVVTREFRGTLGGLTRAISGGRAAPLTAVKSQHPCSRRSIISGARLRKRTVSSIAWRRPLPPVRPGRCADEARARGDGTMSAVSERVAVPAPLASEQDSVVARTRRNVLILTLLLVVGAAAVLSYRTDLLFEAELGPEVLGKSETMADFLAADVKLAISYGIPLTKLVRVSQNF